MVFPCLLQQQYRYECPLVGSGEQLMHSGALKCLTNLALLLNLDRVLCSSSYQGEFLEYWYTLINFQSFFSWIFFLQFLDFFCNFKIFFRHFLDFFSTILRYFSSFFFYNLQIFFLQFLDFFLQLLNFFSSISFYNFQVFFLQQFYS